MDYLQINELYHWGVKGMKWGVRNYMNEDGTLTPEGQKHYNIDSNGNHKRISVTGARLNEFSRQRASKSYYKNGIREAKTNLEITGDRKAYKQALKDNKEMRKVRDANIAKENTDQARRIKGSSIAFNVASGASIAIGAKLVSKYLKNTEKNMVKWSPNGKTYMKAAKIGAAVLGAIGIGIAAKGVSAYKTKKKALKGKEVTVRGNKAKRLTNLIPTIG